jgi:ribose transport system permease protein
MASEQNNLNSRFKQLATNYGMLGVLLLLCVFFSLITISDQHPTGKDAAESIFANSFASAAKTATIVIALPATAEDSAFGITLSEKLKAAGFTSVYYLSGDPASIRTQLTTIADSIAAPMLIATSELFSPVVQSIHTQIEKLQNAQIVTPPTERWPTFLLADNIRNVANQITVVAIIAIGMTMVIITAGIDLSVGSLIALSAVLIATLIGNFGSESASGGMMLFASVIGILVCGGIGAFSGFMITNFRIAPFIATLAMMQVAAGLAYIISEGKPVYQVPDSFVGLGRGVDPLLHIPFAVILMVVLYCAAHILMTRTTLGRYLYAVGGNKEAARLAGIRVTPVLLFAYTISGIFAGLGGLLLASQLKSGAPTYGLSYELYVIAAVVVGGTSLSGGEGKIFGTLIGAFVIGVIQNGMNLTNVESYTQKVVLGLVILGAVLLDQLKHRDFKIRS